MDPVYLQGLRDAKALLDDGIYTQQDLDKERVKLEKQRDERAAAAVQQTPPMPKPIRMATSSPTNHQQNAHSACRLASINMNEMLDAEDHLNAQLQKTSTHNLSIARKRCRSNPCIRPPAHLRHMLPQRKWGDMSVGPLCG
jgi:hypothetical protein